MAKLRLVPWAEGDRQFFDNEEVYQNYLKIDKGLSEQPLDIQPFDWKYFLKTLFLGE